MLILKALTITNNLEMIRITTKHLLNVIQGLVDDNGVWFK